MQLLFLFQDRVFDLRLLPYSLLGSFHTVEMTARNKRTQFLERPLRCNSPSDPQLAFLTRKRTTSSQMEFSFVKQSIPKLSKHLTDPRQSKFFKFVNELDARIRL